MSRNMMKSLATVSGLTMVSRLLGFVRQILMAGIIGAGGNPVADAFWAAFRLPNMFRRLFAEGAFHAAFIPMFQDRNVASREESKLFAEEVMAGLVFLLTALTVLVELAAPAFVWLIAAGFKSDPEKFALTTLYTRIMFPYLMCMSLVGLMSGILNSFGRFAASAGAPLALNICLIIGLLFFAKSDLEITGMAAAWAVFAGGLVQLGILMFGISRQNFTLRLRRPRLTPAVKRLFALGAPGFISAGALQINLIIGTNIASREPGAVSWLMNADALYQLPLAVIGIALGSVLLPGLSREVKQDNHPEAIRMLNRSIEVAALFCFPAACAFLVMAEPICDALYRGLAGEALSLFGIARSAFTADDVMKTGAALSLFGIGLPAFVWLKVFSPAFFAREDTRTPMNYAIIAIVINVVLALSLFPVMGFLSIAIATSIAAWAQVTLLAQRLYREKHFQPDGRLSSRIIRIMIATAGMGGFLYLSLQYQDEISRMLLDRNWLAIVAIAALGLIVYGLLSLIIGAAHPRDLKPTAKT